MRLRLLQFLLSFNTLLVIPFAIGLLILLLRRRWAVDHALPHERRAARCRRAACALGLVAAALLVYVPVSRPHRGWLAGPLFGLFVLAGVLAGELLAPRPAGTVRSATLTTRQVRDYLPRRHRALLAALLACLAALLAGMTAITVAHSDDRGSISFTRGDVTTTFPSAWVGAPAVAATVLSLVGSAVACLFVLRKIVNRPAVTADPQSEARDAAMREVSAGAVFYAWGCLLAASLFTWSLVARYVYDSTTDLSDTSWWPTTMRVAAYLPIAASGYAFVYLFAKLTRQHAPHQATA